MAYKMWLTRFQLVMAPVFCDGMYKEIQGTLTTRCDPSWPLWTYSRQGEETKMQYSLPRGVRQRSSLGASEPWRGC